MQPYLRFIPLGMFLLIAFVLASGLFMPDKETLTRPAILESYIPDFNLPRLDDESAFLIPRNWRGQVAVLNFFASWCEPCTVEHPVLMKLAQLPEAKLYGIAWKDDPAKANEYLSKLGNPYALAAADQQGSLTVPFGLSGVPETILIDKQGIVRWKYAGPLTDEIVANQLYPLIQRYAAQP